MRPVSSRILTFIAILSVATAGAASAQVAAPVMDGSAMPPRMSNLVVGLLPQVVSLSVVSYSLAPPATTPTQQAGENSVKETRTLGSGFIIDPAGVIVTNQHVIDNATSIGVILSDGTRLKGTLLAADKIIDIALVKVNAGKNLPAAMFGDSNTIEPGDEVIAIGNPLGLGESVSSGIVSALDRDIHSSPYDAYIQTDAAINHGNSGGPLYNIRGEVIGMNTALIAPPGETGSIGLGFAIPGADVQFVINEMRKYGRVRPAWLGAEVQHLSNDLADGLGVRDARGSVVLAVDAGGPAAKAGLRFGDVIIKVGDKVVDDVRMLNRSIAVLPLDSVQKLTILRDGHPQVVDVTITERIDPATAPGTPMVMPPHVARADMGLEVAPISEALRQQFGLDAAESGLVVTSVVPNSVAAERDSAAGSVVLRVDETPVGSLGEWHDTMAKAWAGDRRNMLVLLKEKTGLKLVALPTTVKP
jgi:serine protease Do